eukprot:2200086-Alexandrium_andersonii.AAC.1
MPTEGDGSSIPGLARARGKRASSTASASGQSVGARAPGLGGKKEAFMAANAKRGRIEHVQCAFGCGESSKSAGPVD